MSSAEDKVIFKDTIRIPQILLPADAEMYAWAVNACDQFTSDADYWRGVENLTSGKPSTYHIIFPEIYLKDEPQKRILNINSTMQRYLSGGIFKDVEGGFVLVERRTASGVRTGLVLAVDLESYSFVQEDKALIRSTEATILDRLPPRIEIRRNAPLELPHIMLLYDDPDGSVLGCVRRGEVLYDFELNMNGGHVKGTYVSNAEEVKSAFYSLPCCRGADKMLFAVGDGNHSLAAAKKCWEEVKKGLGEEELDSHPARYALCEAVNIYDNALEFHPIHRFIKTAKPQKFAEDWKIEGDGSVAIVADGEKMYKPFPENIPAGIRMLDEYISEFLKKYGGEVDYIHGESELISLTAGGVGVILPSIKKEDFFPLILSGGNLPKKTFSLGEGNEKRYYIEAKRIK